MEERRSAQIQKMARGIDTQKALEKEAESIIEEREDLLKEREDILQKLKTGEVSSN